MPPVVPIGIFVGGADAEDDEAKPQPTRATTVTPSPSVRRCHKVVPLYHKVDVNRTRLRCRQRRSDDPARRLPDEPASEADDRGGPRAGGAPRGGLPGLR